MCPSIDVEQFYFARHSISHVVVRSFIIVTGCGRCHRCRCRRRCLCSNTVYVVCIVFHECRISIDFPFTVSIVIAHKKSDRPISSHINFACCEKATTDTAKNWSHTRRQYLHLNRPINVPWLARAHSCLNKWKFRLNSDKMQAILLNDLPNFFFSHSKFLSMVFPIQFIEAKRRFFPFWQKLFFATVFFSVHQFKLIFLD